MPSTAGRTLPFDRSFGNIFDEATGWFSVTFLNEAIRPGVLIVADHSFSLIVFSLLGNWSIDFSYTAINLVIFG